jgi:hypothetical protein
MAANGAAISAETAHITPYTKAMAAIGIMKKMSYSATMAAIAG